MKYRAHAGALVEAAWSSIINVNGLLRCIRQNTSEMINLSSLITNRSSRGILQNAP